MKKKRD